MITWPVKKKAPNKEIAWVQGRLGFLFGHLFLKINKKGEGKWKKLKKSTLKREQWQVGMCWHYISKSKFSWCWQLNKLLLLYKHSFSVTVKQLPLLLSGPQTLSNIFIVANCKINKRILYERKANEGNAAKNL